MHIITTRNNIAVSMIKSTQGTLFRQCSLEEKRQNNSEGRIWEEKKNVAITGLEWIYQFHLIPARWAFSAWGECWHENMHLCLHLELSSSPCAYLAKRWHSARLPANMRPESDGVLCSAKTEEVCLWKYLFYWQWNFEFSYCQETKSTLNSGKLANGPFRLNIIDLVYNTVYLLH